jgi:hypothetical protein
MTMIPARRETVQQLLGNKDVWTNVIYTHVLNRVGRGVGTAAGGRPANGLAGLPDERKAEAAYHAQTGVTGT